jgi:hypothetical protein
MTTKQIIHQVIEKEISIGKYLLSGYSEKIKLFEKKYKITTSDFVRLFENGKMGDEQDFFEWIALYKGKKHWEEKLSALKAV